MLRQETLQETIDRLKSLLKNVGGEKFINEIEELYKQNPPGTLQVSLKYEAIISLPVLIEAIEKLQKVCDGQPYHFLIDFISQDSFAIYDNVTNEWLENYNEKEREIWTSDIYPTKLKTFATEKEANEFAKYLTKKFIEVYKIDPEDVDFVVTKVEMFKHYERKTK